MPPQQGVLEIEGPADECDKKEELQHQLEEDGKASFPFEHEQQEPSLWDEWRAQIKTAWPTLLGMLLYKVPWMVSLRFVGGIGAGELAAAALASTLCNVTGMSLSVGLSSALTTLAGQARGHALRKRQLQHNADVKAWEKEQSFLDETETLDELGDEDLEDVSFLPSNDASSSLATTNNKNKPLMPLVFLFRGMFIQLLLVIPVGIWWLCGIEDVLVRLGQGEELSHMTQNYLRILTPGLWAYSVNWTLTCWLQTMEMADVPAIAAGIGLTAHVPLNFLFVYGLNWGYLGCAAATVCCQGLQPIFIVCYLCSARGKARLWDQMGASPSSGSPPSTLGPTLRLAVSKGLGQYLSLALPGIVIISEWWASEISIFLSGRFDNAAVTLGAMTLYQSINTALFMFPVACSVAGATRVSTWLGAGQAHAAAKASAVSVAGAAAISGALGIMLYVTPHTFFPSLFAPTEKDLYEQAGELMPLLALYVFADGIQTALNGTIKGCGRQALIMPVVIVAYWVVGLPLAYHWAFDENCTNLCGDVGLVSGMTAGTWVHMLILAVLVLCSTNWPREAEKAHARMIAHDDEDDAE